MTERLHVLIEGMVQGVGFRFATQRKAGELGLDGWVRNLPGGRVEAEFEGPRHALDQMLEWCTQGPRLAQVTKVEANWDAGEKKYKSFQLRGW